MAQTIKNLPAMQETQVQLLGQENPLEKGMATHFIIIVLEIPRQEEPGGIHRIVQSMASEEVTESI